MRFTIPAMIYNIQFERKIEISQDDGDADIEILKIPILFHSSLQNSLLIIDDIGSNADIQRFSFGLEISANGASAYSAESGTVWMYDQNRYNSGYMVPDQISPASDATPLTDSGTAVAETLNEYSRRNHQHPQQLSTVLPSRDTSFGNIGPANTYARSDHQHPILTVYTNPISDLADGSYGTVDSYPRNDHSHPIMVQTNASIVPIVNGVGNNDTSAYYSRHNHIHPQQLTYDGNVTATKFIKIGGTVNDISLVDGNTNKVVLATTCYDDGLRISRTVPTDTGNSLIQLGCSRTSNMGTIDNQWQIFTPPSSYTNNPLGLNISLSADSGDNTRGLQICVDGNTLTFNGRVLQKQLHC
ncbi:MAG: hypothetical protein EZS28_002527 [Streblomastix strix]|uniref:Uncharacterized protein n=1 Tax=Streblomastix strix TaxID=222440 RepID=A0A5J4X3Y6_9EUKA|nr:MAG: hypothetical protein EZS28_002527 [Streblomastix strix]